MIISSSHHLISSRLSLPGTLLALPLDDAYVALPTYLPTFLSFPVRQPPADWIRWVDGETARLLCMGFT